MKHACLSAFAAVLLLTPAALFAQNAPKAAPSPGEIVASAAPSEWMTIAPKDMLVMDLASDRDGNARRVVIQLMPPPFSQGWIGNIRTLAAAHWWDGSSINRVQDNYVVQWGDASEKKPLPDGLSVVPESEYTLGDDPRPSYCGYHVCPPAALDTSKIKFFETPYSQADTFFSGWPVGEMGNQAWPVHCYGMVGVGRNLSPDTGTGAELYTVIGHAPRHLDRNIALVGRVIEGIEHISSLPRGKGDLGFYADASKRVPITSVRLASELPAAEQPRFEYLSTESATFAKYAEARANRRDPFFTVPAGGADICNIPVPVWRITE